MESSPILSVPSEPLITTTSTRPTPSPSLHEEKNQEEEMSMPDGFRRPGPPSPSNSASSSDMSLSTIQEANSDQDHDDEIPHPGITTNTNTDANIVGHKGGDDRDGDGDQQDEHAEGTQARARARGAEEKNGVDLRENDYGSERWSERWSEFERERQGRAQEVGLSEAGGAGGGVGAGDGGNRDQEPDAQVEIEVEVGVEVEVEVEVEEAGTGAGAGKGKGKTKGVGSDGERFGQERDDGVLGGQLGGNMKDEGERKQDEEIEGGLKDGFEVTEPKTRSKHEHNDNDKHEEDENNDNDKTLTRGLALTPVHPSVHSANPQAQARAAPQTQAQPQPSAYPVPITINTLTSNSEPDTSFHIVPPAQNQTQTQTRTQFQEQSPASEPRVKQPTPTPTLAIKTTSSGGDDDGGSGRGKSVGGTIRGGLGEDRAGSKGRGKNSVERDSPGNPFIQRGTPTSTSTPTLGNTNSNFNKAGPGTLDNTNAATRNSDFGRKLQEVSSSSSIHNNTNLADIDKDNHGNDNDDSAFHDTLNGRRRFSTRSALSRGEDSIFEAQPGDASRMVDGHGHGYAYGAEPGNDEYDPAFEFRTSWEVLRNSVYSLVEDGKMFHLLPSHLACDRCISESLIDRPNCKIVIPNDLDPAVLHEAMSSASAHREACTACLYAHESCSFQQENEEEDEVEKEEEEEETEPEPVMDTMAELTQGTLSMMTDNNDAESTFTHAFEGVFENSIRQYYNDPRRETYETCKANLKLVDEMAKGQAGEDESWVQRYRQRLGNCVKDWKAKDRVSVV